MADSVQYIMDRLSSHFRQLEELEIFTNTEIRSIVKKRTDFEYVMKRRQLFIEDFYNYIQYEINLDKLRVLRCDKMDNIGGGNKEKQDAMRNVKATCSRHICSIFDRATRRFPNNMDMWTDYIAYLKDSKSTSILNTVFGKALALHPKCVDFWLQAAVHELDENNNVQAARILFQRALRVNKHSKNLWLRYFEMELWNASRVVERANILGLEENNSQALLKGTPAVVFKHALVAVPDLELACEMHASSLAVDDGLGMTLERHMRDTFGGRAELWGHLACIIANRIAKDAAAADGSDSSAKKRKRRDGEGGTSLVAAAARLELTLALLEEGKAAVMAHGQDTEIAAFHLLESSVIGSCLDKLLVVAGNLGAGAARAAEPTPAKKPKSKGGKKSDSSATSDSSLGIADHVPLLAAAAKRLAELTGASIGGKGDDSRARLLGLLTGRDLTAIPLFIAVCTANHQLFTLFSLAPRVDASTHIPSAATGADCLLFSQQLLHAGEHLMRAGALSSAVGSAVWGLAITAMKHWCRGFEACSRACSVGRALPVDAASLEALAAVADAGLSTLPLAVCCDEGSTALALTLQALELAGRGEDVKSYWKRIISSTHFDPLPRGEWCKQYLHWSLSKAAAAASPSSSSSSSSFSSQLSTHRAVLELVERFVKSSAPAVLGPDMAPFYSQLLAAQMEIFRAHATAKKSKCPADIVAMTRHIAERATAACPEESAFWQTREEVERLVGNHAAANHLQWKMSKGDF